MSGSSHPVRLFERVRVGDDFQWILVRGKDRSLPVLLTIQAGPGFPIIHEADALEEGLHWEEEFRVVYWDLRGCGKSFHQDVSFGPEPLDRLALDIREMVSVLRQQLDVESVILVGFSLGASLAALAAHRAPEGIRALVGVGMDVRIEESETMAQDFVMEQATGRKHRKALRALERIGPPPYLESQSFMEHAKWMTEFGGIHRRERFSSLLRKNLWRLFSSPAYTWFDALEALRGISTTQNLLLPAMGTLDLFRQVPSLDVPVFFCQGRHDAVAPPVLLQRYHDLLNAPLGKELFWFEDSAHLPHDEEPVRFAAILREIKNRTEGPKKFPSKVIDR